MIDVMTKLVKPQPGERCNDPACGTFGFMISASQYVRSQTDDFFDLDADTLNSNEKKHSPDVNWYMIRTVWL